MKNRITNVWDSIIDPALKLMIRDAEVKRARAFALILREPDWGVSIRSLTHAHPLDPTRVYYHQVLYLGCLPVLVVHTDMVSR